MVRLGELVEESIPRRKLSELDLVTFVGMQDLSEDGMLKTQHVMKYQRIKAGLTYFERNDVLIAKITPCFENGKGANLINLRTQVGYGSTEFHVLRAKNGCDPGYIYQQTISSKFRRRLESEMVGTAGHRRVSLSAIEDYELLVSHSSEEQKAIAKALSDVDELIVSLEKLIAKKRDIKTATMQQLLTGNLRLPGFGEGKGYKQTELGEIPEDWDVVLLKELCGSFKTGKLDANEMKPDGEYRFYTCARKYYWIDSYAFDTEALLVSGNGANVGYVHYYKGRFNAYQRTYVISDFYADLMYLKVYMERKIGERIRVEVNAGNTPYITMDTLTDMAVVLPLEIEEQKAISTVLFDMDTEINNLAGRLNKTKSIKQGMMQELLTGRTRLVDVAVTSK